MKDNLYLLIVENRNKLTIMVENNAPYEEILKQSKLLDELINEYNNIKK